MVPRIFVLTHSLGKDACDWFCVRPGETYDQGEGKTMGRFLFWSMRKRRKGLPFNCQEMFPSYRSVGSYCYLSIPFTHEQVWATWYELLRYVLLQVWATRYELLQVRAVHEVVTRTTTIPTSQWIFSQLETVGGVNSLPSQFIPLPLLLLRGNLSMGRKKAQPAFGTYLTRVSLDPSYSIIKLPPTHQRR